MSKLDVGVGDEFPAEEIRRDENGVVHHHHYYPRRRPFRLLRLVLGIALIVLVIRAFHYAEALAFWNMPFGMAMGPFFPLGSIIALIAIIGVVLWFLRCHHTQGGR
jgi:hypothetical protein